MVINFFERDGNRTFDCSPVIDADGTLLGVTRMIHITEYPCFHEQGYYTPGDKGAPVFRRRPAASACRSVTTATFPNTCARWRSTAPISSIVPQAGAVGEWPEGLYEAEMRVAAFQNGYYMALCNRVGAGGLPELRRGVVRLRAGRRRSIARAAQEPGRDRSTRKSTLAKLAGKSTRDGCS